MQDALAISPERWGWVGTVFLLGYALFEIPSGHLGDRVGSRRILTRIVLWWSLFTALTGAVSVYSLLLVVRFLFGVGEAGAFPVASVAISNWFPQSSRGAAFGLLIMSSQLGGALSPLLVIPIQQHYGWRMSFYVFGCLGVVWSALWFWQFRDKPSVPDSTPRDPSAPAELVSWMPILRSPDLWAIMVVTFGYIYTMSFYQTWLHTYLVKGRAFSEQQLSLSALPYLCGAAANLTGGFLCDWLVPIVGLKWSRRYVGIVGLFVATIGLAATRLTTGNLAVIVCLSLAYSGITLQQPVVFAACLDIGGTRGGAVSGFMNTAGQIGGAISSVIFGYIVKASGSYDGPLLLMAALLLLGILAWGKVDATSRIDFAPLQDIRPSQAQV
jgi:MFS family permease